MTESRLAETVLVTERLVIRRLTPDDAQFMYGIWNDPAFMQYVGDRGIRSLEAARDSILSGPVEMYRRFGFGLYLVALRETAEPIGICGLLKREALEDVDIGFAFLPAFRSRGYALEAASAVMDYGREVLRLERIVAIVNPDNERSQRLLERVGMRFERMIRMPGESRDIRLFAWTA
jgi:RimJ/RimL family protein N-acetyltransferase